MASELMNKNMENFSYEQQKCPYVALNFDDIIESLPIHTFPQLLKAYFGVAGKYLAILPWLKPIR